ncbi:MAG: pyridoxal 5'-phosphate synthase glutaminase subunit PdxT [Firmicutes bacterium]|nr:pyridoxal 5'-phosphate synthase glutaminase subunit PdxT [Bacillota bacterium]
MIVGILAIQGAFIEHTKVLAKLDIKSFEIRQKKDLMNPMDGLILPGGESTTMGRLLTDLDMFSILQEKIKSGLPVLGTCAGMILLARTLTNSDKSYFQTMDISVERNAYGRQLGSFFIHEKFNNVIIPMTFIRAPYVHEVGPDVLVLSTVDQKIVAVQQNNQLATAFHPELTDSTYVHEYFLDIIRKRI